MARVGPQVAVGKGVFVKPERVLVNGFVKMGN